MRHPLLRTAAAVLLLLAATAALGTAPAFAATPAGPAGPADDPRSDPAAVHFLPGWQDAARPLLYRSDRPGGSVWRAPETLPSGSYVVIERDALGVPRLLPHVRFKVSGRVGEQVLVTIAQPVRSPEALAERYVSGQPATAAASGPGR